ncbi:MAG: RHS repeat-associated core domain-containing protein [Verrucomicrobiales bacterium]|nr:RHS repeat-associated core domain-containing protein [Verrucomicrobiales bacterium]
MNRPSMSINTSKPEQLGPRQGQQGHLGDRRGFAVAAIVSWLFLPCSAFHAQSAIRTEHSAIANPYLFQGARYDAETGFYYFRNRYYDPRAGRFLQRDPVWDKQNVGGWQTFVGNGPVARRDPHGLDDKEEPVEGAKQVGGFFDAIWDRLTGAAEERERQRKQESEELERRGRERYEKAKEEQEREKRLQDTAIPPSGDPNLPAPNSPPPPPPPPPSQQRSSYEIGKELWQLRNKISKCGGTTEEIEHLKRLEWEYRLVAEREDLAVESRREFKEKHEDLGRSVDFYGLLSRLCFGQSREQILDIYRKKEERQGPELEKGTAQENQRSAEQAQTEGGAP